MARGRPEMIPNAVRRAIIQGKNVVVTGGGKPNRLTITVKRERLYKLPSEIKAEKAAKKRGRNKK